MGRIIGYQYDDNVQDGDAWIGSEDGGGRTKQYTAEAVANYLNIQGKISIVGQMTYKYGITPLSGPGTFAVFGGGTDPVAFSAITKLTLSNTDVSKQRVVEFLNLLVGSDILISKQSAISTFGYYSIDNYAVNATDPAYYDLGVTFKSGNGSMEAEQIYETQNFTLAAEENISTLQTTIDAGNTYASGTSLWQWDPGKISQVDPDEEWGLALSPEEGVIFTDGVGNSAGRSYLQATNLRIGNLTYTGSVFADNLTANRNFQLPNNSGTLALTTDITASPWDTVTGGINYANGNVGIGTTTPSAKLDVNGDALINGLTVGQGAGTSAFGNTVFGKTALDSITTGRRNVAIGNEALLDNTVGNHNIALGYRSLENNSASNNVAIGVEALQRVEAAGNNTAVGRYALALTSGAGNTAIGYAAGYLRVGGTNGGSINSVFIGSLTTSNGINPENEIVIGTGAESAGSNTVVLGNDDIVSTRLKGDVIIANGNVGIGTTSPSEKLDVAGNIKLRGTNNLTIGSTSSGGNFSLSSGIRGFNFANNNGDLVRIDSAGNVGIGTTSPGAKLEVVDGGGNGQVNENILVNMPSASNYVSGTANTIGFKGLSQYFGALGGYTNGAPGLGFWNGVNTGTPSMVLIAGNVGIGTTSPGYKLHNAGTSRLEGRVTLGGNVNNFIQGNGSSLEFKSNGDYFFNKGASTQLTILSNGNVGIGTTSPVSTLQVNNNSATLGGEIKITNNLSTALIGQQASISLGREFEDRSIRLTSVSTGAYGINPDLVITANQNMTGASHSELIRIKNNGNVGIGTTAPTKPLDVRTDIGVLIKGASGSANAKISFVPASGGRQYDLGNAGSDFRIFDSSAGVTRMHFDNDGNTGIGTTSPSQKLEVAGNTLINNSGDGKLYLGSTSDYIGNIGSDIYMYSSGQNIFYSGGSEQMRIKTNGNVGIGTTNPGAKLDVSTTAIIGSSSGTGTLTIGNTLSNPGSIMKMLGYTSTYKNWQLGNGLPTGGVFSITPSTTNGGTTFTTPSFVIDTNSNVGIGTASPTSRLDVAGGDIELDDAAAGIIMRSPDGTKYRITVANGGTLTVTAV